MHLDLLASKLIPDGLDYRDNEAKLQWIQDADWEYRRIIDAAPALLARKHIDLVFEGLDAYAEVFLNGQKVLVADNMFREWRADVKPYLKAGTNELLVVFPSPIKVAQKLALTDVSSTARPPRPIRPICARPPTNMGGTGGQPLSPAASGDRRAWKPGMTPGLPTSIRTCAM